MKRMKVVSIWVSCVFSIFFAETLIGNATSSVFVVERECKNSGGCYLLADGHYKLNSEQMQLYFLDKGLPMPAYGDIWKLKGTFSSTNIIGLNTMSPIEGAEFIYIGNLFTCEAAETKVLTVASKDEVYVRFSDGDAFSYQWEDGIDWDSVKVGDKVTFLTYEGNLKLSTVVAYAGDANSDNAVTIADVIFLNRQILGDTGTARSTFNQELADYDGNGIIDAADSLMILKRIVELI